MRASHVLITAFLAFANAGHAGVVDWQAARDAGMPKLAEAAKPEPAPLIPFLDEAGAERTLADWKGKVLLVNFWATWCAPCRKEMKGLSELQAEFGGDDFEVLTIATGRNMPAAMTKFFAEIGVDNLPLSRDPTQGLAREMAVLGLPVSVILSPSGHEIARMTGDAEWESDSAKAIIRTLISGDS